VTDLVFTKEYADAAEYHKTTRLTNDLVVCLAEDPSSVEPHLLGMSISRLAHDP